MISDRSTQILLDKLVKYLDTLIEIHHSSAKIHDILTAINHSLIRIHLPLVKILHSLVKPHYSLPNSYHSLIKITKFSTREHYFVVKSIDFVRRFMCWLGGIDKPVFVFIERSNYPRNYLHSKVRRTGKDKLALLGDFVRRMLLTTSPLNIH